MRSRPIERMELPDLEPGAAPTPAPTFIWIHPATLLVDENYQRNLTRQSLTLIRKIVAHWDWARFKPPIVAKAGATYEVIDGQHTAIAAASHPQIDTIPVMVVLAEMMEERASAFVGHNRDRIGLTPLQIYYGMLAAGDEDAQTVEQVCNRAGVSLPRYPPSTTNAGWKPGECIAVYAIQTLINRRGAMAARVVLQVLSNAHCAPIRMGQIRAVEEILHSREYKGQVSGDDLTSAIMRLGPEADREAKIFSAAHNVQEWRGLTVVYFREGRRGRRRAG